MGNNSSNKKQYILNDLTLKYSLTRTNHPQIDDSIAKFENETECAYTKFKRMIDLSEVIIKTHTAAIMGWYLNGTMVSDMFKVIISHKMTAPSLGTWVSFGRIVMEEYLLGKIFTEEEYLKIKEKLQVDQYPKLNKIFIEKDGFYNINSEEIKSSEKKSVKLSDLIKFLEKINFDVYTEIIDKGFIEYFFKDYTKFTEGDGNIVSLRNEDAHGSVTGKEISIKYMNDYFEKIDTILKSKWLENTKIKLKSNDELVHLNSGLENIEPYLVGEICNFSLFPIIEYNKDEICNDKNHKLVLFNHLKNFDREKIGRLSYETGNHIIDNKIFKRFIEVIDINNWKRIELNDKLKNDIQSLMNSYTEEFYGRAPEIKSIDEFIGSNTLKYCFIQGTPGLGKSALCSFLANKYTENDNLKVISYFIKRSYDTTNIKKFIDYMNIEIDKIYPNDIKIGGSIKECRMGLEEKLSVIPNEILIIIDGLDEAEDLFITKLFRKSYSNVKIIYSSRPGEMIDKLFSSISSENRWRIPLLKLDNESIRKILEGSMNKYMISNKYVKAVEEKSEGNPLYVKLLCIAIELNEKKENDINTLPKNVSEFYNDFLEKYSFSENNENILKTLYLVASAYEPLPRDMLMLMLDITQSQIDEIIREIQEVLVKNDNNEYSLFHETLREHLLDNPNNSTQVSDNCRITSEELILDYCSKWEALIRKYHTHKNKIIFEYPLKYYSKHLCKSKNIDKILELILEDEYTDTQVKVLEDYYPVFDLCRNGIILTQEKKNTKNIVEILSKITQINNKNIWNSTININQKSKDIINKEIINKELKFLHFHDNSKRGVYYLNLLFNNLDNTSNLELILEYISDKEKSKKAVFIIGEIIPIEFMLYIVSELVQKNCDYYEVTNRLAFVISEDKDVINREFIETTIDISNNNYYTAIDAIIENLDEYSKVELLIDISIILLNKDNILLYEVKIAEAFEIINNKYKICKGKDDFIKRIIKKILSATENIKIQDVIEKLIETIEHKTVKENITDEFNAAKVKLLIYNNLVEAEADKIIGNVQDISGEIDKIDDFDIASELYSELLENLYNLDKSIYINISNRVIRDIFSAKFRINENYHIAKALYILVPTLVKVNDIHNLNKVINEIERRYNIEGKIKIKASMGLYYLGSLIISKRDFKKEITSVINVIGNTGNKYHEKYIKKISEVLIKNNYVKEVEKILNSDLKGDYHKEVSVILFNKLLEDTHISKVIKLFESNPLFQNNDKILFNIYGKLIEADNPILSSFSKKYFRKIYKHNKRLRCLIIKQKINSKDWIEILRNINENISEYMIVDKLEQESIVQSLSNYSCEIYNFENAIKIAEKIENEVISNETYEKISSKLIDCDYLTEASDIIKKLNNKTSEKARMLKKLSLAYSKKGYLDKAFEIANTIKCPTNKKKLLFGNSFKYDALLNCVSYCQKYDNIQLARIITDSIERDYTKKKAYEIINNWTKLADTKKIVEEHISLEDANLVKLINSRKLLDAFNKIRTFTSSILNKHLDNIVSTIKLSESKVFLTELQDSKLSDKDKKYAQDAFIKRLNSICITQKDYMDFINKNCDMLATNNFLLNKFFYNFGINLYFSDNSKFKNQYLPIVNNAIKIENIYLFNNYNFENYSLENSDDLIDLLNPSSKFESDKVDMR